MCAPVVGVVIIGSASTLGGEYYFYYNGILFGVVGDLDLALCLIWVVGDADMVTSGVSTLIVVSLLFCYCYTILVYNLVVSG